MTAVVDANFLLAPLQGRPESIQILKKLHEQGSVTAPALLAWETANVLRHLGRRGELTADQESVYLNGMLSNIGLVAPGMTAMLRTLEIARQFGLTAYDAAYLQLAESQEHSSLATHDNELRAAAVQLLGSARLVPREPTRRGSR